MSFSSRLRFSLLGSHRFASSSSSRESTFLARLKNIQGEAPPGPLPHRWRGNTKELVSDYHGTLLSYGTKDPVTLFFVGKDPFVLVTGQEEVRRVLSSGKYRKPRYVGYKNKAVDAAVGQAASETEFTQLKDNDLEDTPALQSIIRGQYPVVCEHARRFAESLTSEHAKEPFNVDLACQRMATNLNIRILFQYKNENLDDFANIIHSTGSEFSRRMIDPWRIFTHPFSNFSYLAGIAKIVGYGRKLVKHLDTTPEKTWVHSWVTRSGMHPLRYFGKVTGLIMAATQTLPLTMAWALYHIGLDPEMQEALFLEANALRTKVSSREGLSSDGLEYLDKLTPDDLHDLVFTERVILETLRCYPPFPLIQRCPEQSDDILNGFTIPAGMAVSIVPWVIHHNEKYWPDPMRFDPSRFDSSSPNYRRISPFVYLPFGRGPFSCAGRTLAMMELKTVLSSVLLVHRLSSVRLSNEIPGVDMHPAGNAPLLVSFETR